VACLILDVRMPGIDGLELQRGLVDREPRIPIVFLTAHASEEGERRAQKAGAVDILRKPVAKEGLLRVLHSVFEKSARDGGESHDD